MSMTRGTVLFVVALAGCSTSAINSMNDAMTPSARIIKDDFDGTQIVRQPSVGAASSFLEAHHTLGFEWSARTPDLVYVTAGTNGITNITELAFNADERIITDIAPASATTEFTGSGAFVASKRRFAMKMADFAAVANAKSVKMRVSRINDYGVSTFGADSPAVVSSKFQAFLQQVEELRTSK